MPSRRTAPPADTSSTAPAGTFVQVQRELDLRVSLPHSAEFLNADLTRYPTDDLDEAEH
jgi:hypothetical protein